MPEDLRSTRGTEAADHETADDQLSKAIVNALVARELIPPHRAVDAARKVAAGAATAEDWTSWVELRRDPPDEDD